MVLRELGRSEVPWGNVPYLLNQMVPILNDGTQPLIPEVITPAREAKALAYGTNGDIDFKEWIRAGYIIKGRNIPTGLEHIESNELNEAINKIINERNKQFKEYSYEK